MISSRLYLFALGILLLCSKVELADPVDQNAMVALYNGFTSKGSLTWDSGADFCTQQGIKCSSGKITEIWAEQKGIEGTIATEIGDLTSLEWLVLYDNNITGTLPTEMGSLKSMIRMWVQSNQYHGTIPTQIWSLPSLYILFLSSRNLSGTISTHIGLAKKLWNLALSGNELTGTLPTEIGRMSNLAFLNIGGELVGTLPTEIGAMKNLKEIGLAGSKLSGAIPAEMGALTNLQAMGLNNNQLTGAVPTEILSLPKLEMLNLANNRFHCPVGDYSHVATNDYSTSDQNCKSACGSTAKESPCEKGKVCAAVSETEHECADDAISLGPSRLSLTVLSSALLTWLASRC